jgi:hypothetical protein
MKRILVCLALALGTAPAQDIKFPPELEKLAAKASEVVDVTLDSQMLGLASRFLSNKEPDEAKVKEMTAKLKGIYVRAYEFDKEGAYSPADLDSIRNQLKGPGWQRMVTVRSKEGDNADIFFRMENNNPVGLVVLAAEPKALTVVNIVGPIDLDSLSDLGGHFGVPKIERTTPKKPAPAKD